MLTIESGDSVVYETRDVSDNQITPGSTAVVIATLDWDRVYPLAGPVLIEGAEPGASAPCCRWRCSRNAASED